LDLTEPDLAQLHDIEIVVYNLESNVTLGAPLVLPMKQ